LLNLNGLATTTTDDPLPSPSAASGPAWVDGMVRRLGFVQVDPISAVERAQHHILFSRNPRYRQQDLTTLLENERKLFENWTHDAAILPIESFPYWRHYMDRVKRFEAHPGYARYFASVGPKEAARVLRRIKKDGALRPRDLGWEKVNFRDDYFAQPSLAKITMELLWRTGKLAVTRREGRQKVYDLSERVIPGDTFRKRVSKRRYVDWACGESLKRLGAGTPTQVARFFDAIPNETTATWCRRRVGKDVVELRLTHADGSVGSSVFALDSMLDLLRKPADAPRSLRLLNPFDPLIHDRRRTLRIFGFDYAVEIWVPPKKRKYGYYVLPILEGDRFTGRVDVKVDRTRGALTVPGLLWEPRVKVTKARLRQLETQLGKLAEFAGVERVVFFRGYAKA
jgi:uncharacterized protein YcaQ